MARRGELGSTGILVANPGIMTMRPRVDGATSCRNSQGIHALTVFRLKVIPKHPRKKPHEAYLARPSVSPLARRSGRTAALPDPPSSARNIIRAYTVLERRAMPDERVVPKARCTSHDRSSGIGTKALNRGGTMPRSSATGRRAGSVATAVCQKSPETQDS